MTQAFLDKSHTCSIKWSDFGTTETVLSLVTYKNKEVVENSLSAGRTIRLIVICLRHRKLCNSIQNGQKHYSVKPGPTSSYLLPIWLWSQFGSGPSFALVPVLLWSQFGSGPSFTLVQVSLCSHLRPAPTRVLVPAGLCSQGAQHLYV